MLVVAAGGVKLLVEPLTVAKPCRRRGPGVRQSQSHQGSTDAMIVRA